MGTAASEAAWGEAVNDHEPEEARLRALLKEAMGDCPVCLAEDADRIPADQILIWLQSHGVAPEGRDD